VGTVFVSHRRPEQADADRLAERLGPAWRILAHPVVATAADTWQADCRRLIGEADALICIVGDGTADSPNVTWELQTALALGRPVLALRAEAAAAPALPSPLRGPLVEPADLPGRLDAVTLSRAG
jgi:hypothetical protein